MEYFELHAGGIRGASLKAARRVISRSSRRASASFLAAESGGVLRVAIRTLDNRRQRARAIGELERLIARLSSAMVASGRPDIRVIATEPIDDAWRILYPNWPNV